MLLPPDGPERELFLDELNAEPGESITEIAQAQLRAHLEAQGIEISDEELEALSGAHQAQRTGDQEVLE